MLPQVAVGAGTPTPKKPRDASSTMTPPSWAVTNTNQGARHWGAMCNPMTLTSEAPMALAASMYEFSLTERDTERITRTDNGMRVMAMATITVNTPAPNPNNSTIARMRVGKDKSSSTIRWL